MLKKIVAENWFKASAVIGFWPANAVGDDIVVYDETRKKEIATLHTLRQQLARREGRANVALVDFVAPREIRTSRIISAASSSPPASARTTSPSASSTPTTIIPRSWSRRWPIVWRRPLPSGCIERVRKEFWGYRAGRNIRRRTI